MLSDLDLQSHQFISSYFLYHWLSRIAIVDAKVTSMKYTIDYKKKIANNTTYP